MPRVSTPAASSASRHISRSVMPRYWRAASFRLVTGVHTMHHRIGHRRAANIGLVGHGNDVGGTTLGIGRRTLSLLAQDFFARGFDGHATFDKALEQAWS